MQMAIARKGCVAPYPVDRNTQQFRAVSVKLRENLVVERHLIATDRAPVGGIDARITGLPLRSESVRF
jgi:hypothetical protein